MKTEKDGPIGKILYRRNVNAARAGLAAAKAKTPQ